MHGNDVFRSSSSIPPLKTADPATKISALAETTPLTVTGETGRRLSAGDIQPDIAVAEAAIHGIDMNPAGTGGRRPQPSRPDGRNRPTGSTVLSLA